MKKEVRNFIGYAIYYCHFIEDFSKIASPLFLLLSKDAEFNWSDTCDTTLVELKKLVSQDPVLNGPRWKLPFHISSDTSDIAIGAMMGQELDKKLYAIYFISKNLTPTELNYTIIEKEFLTVVHAINKFHHYIIGYPTFVHTNHSAIRYLMNKPITSGRITRWLLLLQEFDITIVNKPRKDNVVADFLSRLNTNGENLPVEDNFLDEHLFAISTLPPWNAYVVN